MTPPAKPAFACIHGYRCTNKLLKVLGGRSAPADEVAAEDADWHASLLWFDRRKCVLLTHSETLFSVFVPDVKKSDMTPIGPFAAAHIAAALAAEGLTPHTLGHLDAEAVRITKTSSRTVLGCMNDNAWMIENDLIMSGGLIGADIDAVNHRLRRAITIRTATSSR